MKSSISNNRLAMAVVVVIVALIVIVLINQSSNAAVNPAVPVEVKMSLEAEPNPPAVGASTLIITLKESGGKAVDGAKLSVQGDMEHAGMMPVKGSAETSTNGQYRVPFEWSMGGGWIVTVTATLPDNRTIAETFKLDVEAVSKNSVINQGTAQPTPSH